MIEDFKTFILRGNVIDMAVGIIIGVAFGAIVTSLVNDIVMPPIGFLLGNIDFSNLFLNMSGTDYASLSEARAAGAPVIAYGAFITTIINFLIIALVVFLMIRVVNNLVKIGKKNEAAAAPVTKECPFCFSSIAIKATRCSHCTSQLDLK
ncbi:MAG: large conductance mechanosensitive channel protein MscL [Dehalococcoidales bacterium]|nr:large conductance mechanosensitive channel protein MscL [Dehalococcoidales bacterium]